MARISAKADVQTAQITFDLNMLLYGTGSFTGFFCNCLFLGACKVDVKLINSTSPEIHFFTKLAGLSVREETTTPHQVCP